MAGPGALWFLAEELLDAAVDSLDTIPLFDATLDGAPERRLVTAGAPVLDCCDQLAVDVVQVLDAATGPGGLSTGRKIAAKINHVYLTTTITRCFPMPDSKGDPPPIAEIEAASRQIDADGWALWNHLYNLWRGDQLFTLCGEVFWDSLRPLGPSGGCAGWTLAIHVSLSGYEETFST